MRAVHLPGIAIAVCALTLSISAQAHEGAGGNVGLGVGIGAPTALSLELAPNPWTAFELALGLHDVSSDDAYGHLVFKADVLRLARGPSVIVPIYLGVGGFIHDHNGTDVGIRAPLGVNFDFTRSTFQIFGEVALEAVVASERSDERVALAGMAGARVWF